MKSPRPSYLVAVPRRAHLVVGTALLAAAAVLLTLGCDSGSSLNDATGGAFGTGGAVAGTGGAATGGAAAGGTSTGGAAAGGTSTGGAATGGVATGGVSNGTPAPVIFKHPGALDSKEDLDFVKAKVAAGAEPWKSESDKIKASYAALRVPNAATTIKSNDDNQANNSRDDATAAYGQALVWYITGDAGYGDRSIAILNAWSKLEGFTAGSDQDKLQAGWIGALFGPAAELMRGYSGWAPGDIAAMQGMFKRAFYPQLNTMSTWNGNVDLTQIDAMMSIAVFNDDQAEFDLAVARWNTRTPSYFYLVADGPTVPAIGGDGGNPLTFWSTPTKWVNGLTQETCRDNGHHSQFALGSALHAAEVAWHQGVDLYTPQTARYTAAMELLATQLLTGDMQGTCSKAATTTDLYDTWEIGYNHFHNRKKLALPKTDELIRTKVRVSAPRTNWNLAYETLTHAGG